MATKTFNIGEYAKGGVITVQIHGKNIAVIAKDWDFSKGSKKDSDQSNAKEFDRETVNADDPKAYRQLEEFLGDITSFYYVEQVMNYIKENVQFLISY